MTALVLAIGVFVIPVLYIGFQPLREFASLAGVNPGQ
jgi:hypothetical protein